MFDGCILPVVHTSLSVLHLVYTPYHDLSFNGYRYNAAFVTISPRPVRATYVQSYILCQTYSCFTCRSQQLLPLPNLRLPQHPAQVNGGSA